MSSIVYVTGVPGAGKSTVRSELRRRGLAAVGVDEDHVASFHTTSGDVIAPSGIVDDWAWRQRHVWRIVHDRLAALASSSADVVYLCGSAANEAEVWDSFSIVIALVIDDDTLRRRLAARCGNNFGKSARELELALGWNRTYADVMRSCGAVVIDATRPIGTVVDELVDRSDRCAPR